MTHPAPDYDDDYGFDDEDDEDLFDDQPSLITEAFREPTFQDEPPLQPVPRISIHAFWTNSKTAEAIDKAARDRRLNKAHVAAFSGGIKKATEYYQDTVTPNLILVETETADESVLDQLDALAQVCDAATKVVVIGPINDITLYRELMRQGVSEYMVTPLAPKQVMDTIAALYLDPAAPPLGRIVTFTGARGGVGSSTLAHNTAWSLSEQLRTGVTLVDYDLNFGTAGLDFNQDVNPGVLDLMAAPDRIDRAVVERLLIDCTKHLNLFAAPSALDRSADVDPAVFENVLEILRQFVPNVVVDLPHVWSAWTRNVLLMSDEVVITATPDLASLRNAKQLFELLTHNRPNDAPPKLILNQVGVTKRPEIPVKEFAEAIGSDPVLIIPHEPQLFGAAANNGQMLAELDHKAEAAGAIEDLAGLIVGRGNGAQDPQKNMKSILKRLLARK